MSYGLDIGTLVAHMKAQLASLESMDRILDSQEDAVRNSDTDAVIRSVSQLKGELVQRVQLEQQRDMLTRQWAGELGCSPEEITVSRISEMHAAAKPQLEDLSDRLHRMALQVQTKQEFCKNLMRSELKFVSHLVDALYPGQNSGTYQPGENLPRPKAAMSLDVRG